MRAKSLLSLVSALALVPAGAAADSPDAGVSHPCDTPLRHLPKPALEALTRLLDQGCDPNGPDEHGWSRLYHAVYGSDPRVVKRLLERGADPNLARSDGDQETPLHRIARSESVEVAAMLIAHGADVNKPDKDGLTALHHAAGVAFGTDAKGCGDGHDAFHARAHPPPCWVGNVAMMRCLLSKGADPNRKDAFGRTVLHMAIADHRHDLTALLLGRKVDVTVQDNNGTTPLHLAVREQNAKLIPKLLARGAEVNAADLDGWTPLHVAASDPPMVRLLLARGAKPMLANKGGSTPLHQAAHQGALESLKLLVARGGKPGVTDAQGATPLHLAASNGKVEVARWLIGKKVRADQADAHGLTPLHWWTRFTHRVYPHKDEQVALAALLLEYGAPVNGKDAGDRTPLHHAIVQRNAHAIRLLLARGADPNAASCQGATLLHLAASAGHVSTGRALLDAGARPDARDAFERTPLHWAAFFGHLDFARMLLETKVDHSPVDENGRAPLALATKSCALEVAKALRQAGAVEGTGAEVTHANCPPPVPQTSSHDLFQRMYPHRHGKRMAEELQAFLAGEGDVQARDARGWTALHWAAWERVNEVAQSLLGAGARVDLQDARGRTPLHLAMEHRDQRSGPIYMARLLSDAGADGNVADALGRTPLHEATLRTARMVAELLICRGADSTRKDALGWTPVDYACLRGYEDLDLQLCSDSWEGWGGPVDDDKPQRLLY